MSFKKEYDMYIEQSKKSGLYMLNDIYSTHEKKCKAHNKGSNQHLQPKVSSIVNMENDITNRIRNINPKDPTSKYQPKNYNLIEDKGKKETNNTMICKKINFGYANGDSTRDHLSLNEESKDMSNYIFFKPINNPQNLEHIILDRPEHTRLNMKDKHKEKNLCKKIQNNDFSTETALSINNTGLYSGIDVKKAHGHCNTTCYFNN